MRSLGLCICASAFLPLTLCQEGKVCGPNEISFSGKIVGNSLDSSAPVLNKSALLITVDDANSSSQEETLFSFNKDVGTYDPLTPLEFSFCAKPESSANAPKNYLLRVNVDDTNSSNFFFGELVCPSESSTDLEIKVLSSLYEEKEAPLSVADCDFKEEALGLMPISVVVRVHLPSSVESLPKTSALIVEIIDAPEEEEEDVQSLAVFSSKVGGAYSPDEALTSFLCASVGRTGESYMYEVRASLKVQGDRNALSPEDFVNAKLIPLVVRPDVSDYLLDVEMTNYQHTNPN